MLDALRYGVGGALFGSALWTILKLTFIPAVIAGMLSNIYEQVSGTDEIRAAQKVQIAAQRARVIFADAVFTFHDASSLTQPDAEVTITNNSDAVIRDIRLVCTIATGIVQKPKDTDWEDEGKPIDFTYTVKAQPGKVVREHSTARIRLISPIVSGPGRTGTLPVTCKNFFGMDYLPV